MCPYKDKTFLGATFEEKIMNYATTATAWNSDSTASTKTAEWIQYYRKVKDSEGTEDTILPDQ